MTLGIKGQKVAAGVVKDKYPSSPVVPGGRLHRGASSSARNTLITNELLFDYWERLL